MAFRGRHQHNLDSKGRLTVPARFRAQLADGATLSAGLDPCVSVFTREGYEEFSSRFLGSLSPFDAKGRMLGRHFHGNASDEELDSAGRVKIPKPLAERAGLSGECVVVGAFDHFEIWDAKRWAEEEARIDAGVLEAAESLAAEQSGAS